MAAIVLLVAVRLGQAQGTALVSPSAAAGKSAPADASPGDAVEVDELEAPGCGSRNCSAHFDRRQIDHAKGGQGSGAGADRSAHLSAQSNRSGRSARRKTDQRRGRRTDSDGLARAASAADQSKVSPGARVSQEVLPGQAATLKLQVATIPQGGSATVERLYEITRHRMKFTMPPDQLDRPHRPPAELRDALTGPAPGLETQHPKIVSLAESLRRQASDQGPWEMVKGFWQWTRDNVEFQNGDFRGALFAVENKCGDCEEMSALFVSMCRLSNVIARTVWVEGHDYPEFYLSDHQGVGHWIPAQVVGPAWFGEMAEYRPIFQKGDRFYDRFQKQYTRYVPHTARADGSSPSRS